MRHKNTSFEDALDLVLVHEGGFVDHPEDPGGATNKGVTQAVYDNHRREEGKPKRSVREITDDELHAVYKQYWDRVDADELPDGVDYCIFDASVNSGSSRAARWLQLSVGVSADGIVGPITLSAVDDMKPESIIDKVCDRRMSFLQSLRHWPTFGRGWSNRVENVRTVAKEMANETDRSSSASGDALRMRPDDPGVDQPRRSSSRSSWCKRLFG